MDLNYIKLQQTTTQSEDLAPDEFERIYQMYKNSSFDRSSIIKGKVNTTYAYQSHINTLHTRFSNFNVNVSNSTYHEWDDEEFQTCISLLHGSDHVGITAVDLTKPIALSSVANYGAPKPFYGNKNIRVIDMRPFTNFSFQRNYKGYDSNLCVVKAGDDENEYSLKEIYYSSTNVSIDTKGFTPFSFIEAGTANSNTYTLDKVWYEGATSTSQRGEMINGNAPNKQRVLVEDFYWLNHNEGIGQSERNTYTMPGSDEQKYLIWTNRNFNGDYHDNGTYIHNLILDSPIPVYISQHANYSLWRAETMLWVPDNQLEEYNYIYGTLASTIGGGQVMPKGISTISVYNAQFRNKANWWAYPNKTTYQPQ